jgi:hypothetical protein
LKIDFEIDSLGVLVCVFVTPNMHISAVMYTFTGNPASSVAIKILANPLSSLEKFPVLISGVAATESNTSSSASSLCMAHVRCAVHAEGTVIRRFQEQTRARDLSSWKSLWTRLTVDRFFSE